MPRRYPIGAEPLGDGVHFRLWASNCKRVEVVIEAGPTVELAAEPNGYFSGHVQGLREGAHYRYRLDGGEKLYPDPASRFQPEGPHGPSQVVDPAPFRWTDKTWQGVGPHGQVIYEMHIGTFTREGTWDAARKELPELANAGITCIEMMPVADFPGQFGWGYDGVDLFAPTRLYGSPDDLRRFVDGAHGNGIAVILDVVYNHLGPDGNYLPAFSSAYFSKKYDNEWGDALNFDGPDSAPVREFFLTNAAYWIGEFHFDGLRLDATQQIFDSSEEYIVKAINRRVREAAGGRQTLIVAENEPQHSNLVTDYGVDALWNDDFHHSAVVAVTGHNEAYYTDYSGKPQEFISAAKYGYLFQGQRYKWQKNRRGRPALDFPPAAFVAYTENHDQIANSATGRRLHHLCHPGDWRALMALLLLGPATPMLFQGQEFAASTPFLFFADHHPELASQVRKGRREFLGQFRCIGKAESPCELAAPDARASFDCCKLDFSERGKHAQAYGLARELLRIRKTMDVQTKGAMDGAVLSDRAFVFRYFAAAGDRLLVVNFGSDLHLDPAPEPLLAPPAAQSWRCILSTENPEYGGGGASPVDTEDENWRVPGHAAVLLAGEVR